MAKVSDYLRFFITYPDGELEAFPLSSSLKWDSEENDDYGFSRKVLKDDLLFYNDSNNTFRKLYTLSQDQLQCNELALRIQARKDNVNWVDWQNYTLPTQSGQWDLDKCQCEIKVKLNDIYTCFLKTHKDRKNLLDITESESLSFIQGEIQSHNCIDVEPQPFLWGPDAVVPFGSCGSGFDLSEGWTPVENRATGIHSFTVNYINYLQPQTIVTTYKRQFVSGVTQPSGEGWIAVTGGFASPVKVKAIEHDPTDLDNPDNPTDFQAQTVLGLYIWLRESETYQKWSIVGVINEGEKAVFDNGRSLKNVLEYLLVDCEIDIISDFFGINADATAPSNPEYAYATSHLQDLIIYQTSDIIRASSEYDNATLLNMSFFELWENLKRFKVEIIGVDATTFRIEHTTYKSVTKYLSLTGDLYKYIKGFEQFEFIDSKVPRVELFSDKYKTFNDDFDRAEIMYDNSCTNEGAETEKKFTSPNTVCNIEYLYNNIYISEDSEKMVDTITLVATDGNGAVLSALGVRTKEVGLNRALSWSNLIEALWTSDRPQLIGKMNGREVQFLSMAPNRKPTDVAVRLCLADYIDKFNSSHLVENKFGWCTVEGASYELPRQELEIETLF